MRKKKTHIYVTPLRRSHVQLDNLSKMRVKLAVNTLSKGVADEMREHENEVTQSTQEYICICHNLWEIFNGRHPIKTVQDSRIGTLDNVRDHARLDFRFGIAKFPEQNSLFSSKYNLRGI